MKKFLLIIVFLSSFQVFAYGTNYSVNSNWVYNSSSCRAMTVCPNGMRIYCETFWMNYGNVPSYMSNMCRTRVVPGQFIQCQGYVQQIDAWGNMTWSQANIPLSCY